MTGQNGKGRKAKAETRQGAVEASTFNVWVGGDSTATLHGEFAVTE
jgi:hypothetical protein